MTFLRDIIELEEAVRSAAHTANQLKKATMESRHDARKPVDDILAERESRYGKFEGHAAISQGLKEVLHQAPKWRLLSSAQRESLEMIAHKMARILNGDPTYLDNAIDIVGYAQLMLDAMEAKDGVQS